jgi:signal transduction histidine kinase
MSAGATARVSPVLRALAQDVFLQVFAVLAAVECVVYLAPVVTPHFRIEIGSYAYLLPFLGLQFLGTVVGLSRIRAVRERRFWRDIAAAFGCWLAGTLLAATTSSPGISRSINMVIDTPYFLSYVFLILAIERRPHLGVAAPLAIDRQLRTIGLSAIALGWYAYFVLMPAWVGPEHYHSVAQSEYCYVTLGVVLVALGIRSTVTCEDRRWVLIYATFTVALALNTVTDVLDALVENAVLPWDAGQPSDLIWLVPPAAFLAAVRLRHVAISGDGPVTASGRRATDLVQPVGTAATLLVGALSFPLVDIWMFGRAARSVGVEWGDSLLVLGELGLLTMLALVGYVALGRRRRALLAARREIEDRLRYAQHMEAIGRLAGGVAHDFNNLLTAIVGYNQLALEVLDEADQRRPLLEQVRSAAERATALTRQLLAFSRRQVLRPEHLDVNAVVRRVERILTRLIGEDIVLDMRLVPNAGPVKADAGQLETALLNLAVNARDAMPHGGTLTVTTRRIDAPGSARGEVGRPTGPSVELIVADTGAGIDPAVLPHIFEPFFSTKERDKGTGLGLATVYGIVTQSGGTISVSSQLGQGTSFVIRLPATGDPADVAPLPATA